MASFALSIENWVNKTKANIDEVVKDAIYKLCYEIVTGTPYGAPETWQDPPKANYIPGTAQGNWFASINSYISDFDRDGYARTIDSVMSDIVAVIDGAPGNVFYLSNSTPYIHRLEFDHWSNQAPAGMVRINTARFNQFMDEAAAKITS